MLPRIDAGALSAAALRKMGTTTVASPAASPVKKRESTSIHLDVPNVINRPPCAASQS